MCCGFVWFPIFTSAVRTGGAGCSLDYFSLRTKTQIRFGSAKPSVHLRISLCPGESVNVERRGLPYPPSVNTETDNDTRSSMYHALDGKIGQ